MIVILCVQEQAMSAGCGEEEVPCWISQLNALTAAASRKSPPTKSASKDRHDAGNTKHMMMMMMET
jgi:hypothetical protein